MSYKAANFAKPPNTTTISLNHESEFHVNGTTEAQSQMTNTFHQKVKDADCAAILISPDLTETTRIPIGCTQPYPASFVCTNKTRRNKPVPGYHLSKAENSYIIQAPMQVCEHDMFLVEGVCIFLVPHLNKSLEMKAYLNIWWKIVSFFSKPKGKFIDV